MMTDDTHGRQHMFTHRKPDYWQALVGFRCKALDLDNFSSAILIRPCIDTTASSDSLMQWIDRDRPTPAPSQETSVRCIIFFSMETWSHEPPSFARSMPLTKYRLLRTQTQGKTNVWARHRWKVFILGHEIVGIYIVGIYIAGHSDVIGSCQMYRHIAVKQEDFNIAWYLGSEHSGHPCPASALSCDNCQKGHCSR